MPFVSGRDPCCAEIHVPTTKRYLCNAFQWLCVVIVDAMESHLIEALEFPDTCRERGNGSGINWRLFCAQLAPDKATVQQHRIRYGHLGPPPNKKAAKQVGDVPHLYDTH